MTDDTSGDLRVRVAKILAQRGMASRSEADRLIERGWVEIEGRVVNPGDRALPDADITLNAAATAQLGGTFTIILNKPRGFVSAEDETGGARAASLLVGANFAGDGMPPPMRQSGLRIAGRLSARDRGLVVYTTDSALARRMAADDVGESWRIDFADEDADAASQIETALRAAGKHVTHVSFDGRTLQLDTASLGKGQLSAICRDLGASANVARTRRGEIALPPNLREGKWLCVTPTGQTPRRD